MSPFELHQIQTRRDFFRQCAGGVGAIALAELLAADTAPKVNPLAPKAPHFAPKAKNVIFLFMEGGPSQYELFDDKPALREHHGQPLPPSLTKDLRLAFIKPNAAVMGSSFRFQRYGKCGTSMSELLPQIGSCADDICLIRSMKSDAFNHHPGQLLLFTGSIQFGRPSMGSWAFYGLGSESKNLPGFVVLTSGRGTSGGASNFQSGFLPSHYQGTVLRNNGEPILYLTTPEGVGAEEQKLTIDYLSRMNEERFRETGDAEIASRIASYELAFRMQSAAPDLLDFSKEPSSLVEAYGINSGDELQRQFGRNCLMARRLVERGVRFVLMMDASWDHHSKLNSGLPQRCKACDQPIATLIRDLKQRGLLDETLLVWGGEFGRTPMVEIRKPEEADNAGRDHHPNAYSMWMAGGGIKGGQVIGSTDEFGLTILEDQVHVHDLQATMLHCLGFDHTRLTHRYAGRDFRLTDIHGNVVRKLLA
jgi:hypothetical protein